jgi:hypothetical protein
MEERIPVAAKLYLDGTGCHWQKIDFSSSDMLRYGESGEIKVWYYLPNDGSFYAKTYYRDGNDRLIHDGIEWDEGGNELNDKEFPTWEFLELSIFPEDLADINQLGGTIETDYLRGRIRNSPDDPGDPQVSVKKFIEGEKFIVRLKDMFVLLEDVTAIHISTDSREC